MPPRLDGPGAARRSQVWYVKAKAGHRIEVQIVKHELVRRNARLRSIRGPNGLADRVYNAGMRAGTSRGRVRARRSSVPA